MAGLDDFLGGVAVVPRSVERPSSSPLPVAAGDSDPSKSDGGFHPGSTETGNHVPAETSSEGLSTEAPQGVTEIILPSGLEVYYQAAPKRLYRVRQGLLAGQQGDPTDWVEVPSVSTITKILDKPGLVDWAEKIGINLVQELLRNEWVDPDFAKQFNAGENPKPREPWWGGAHLREIGKQKRLTNYYMKDAAATRGDSVHKALEGWAMSGKLMDPEAFPENERGYVRGLNKWIEESRFQPLRSEVIVASLEHKVAGRFDLYGMLPEQVELFVHLTEKGKGDRREVVEPDTYIVDLKTSAGVYEDHHIQVTTYRGLCQESGYETPKRAAVLRVTIDGRYQFVESRAEWLDFWLLRGLYDSLERIKGKL